MLYFAYGMNNNTEEMAHRCPGAKSLGHARLINHSFRFARHADVEPCDNSFVDGVLWEITDDTLVALDALEGYPYPYTRFSIMVHTDRGSDTALVYQMVDQSFEQSPSTYYYNLVTEGYVQNSVPVDQLIATMELS
jgi:gamma-glutamylcyclotransferase (GGCT)/AIG2-like uncharacterized protein YtfP